MDVLAHCQEQARRAVRARGWTSAVADDAANAATAVFYNEIQALREQRRGAVALLVEAREYQCLPIDLRARINTALRAAGVEPSPTRGR